MKPLLKNIGWMICAGLMFAGLGVSSVIAQPAPHSMDPGFRHHGIEKPMDSPQNLKLDLPIKEEKSKIADELKAEHEVCRVPAQDSLSKPVEPGPHVLQPVPRQKQPVIAGPDKIKPTDSSSGHSHAKRNRPADKRIHVSDKLHLSHRHAMKRNVMALPHDRLVKCNSSESEDCKGNAQVSSPKK